MNNFEQKILNMKSSSHPNSDSDQFLSKLHGRIEESEQNKKTIMTSFIMIFVIGFLSWSQLGVSVNEDIFYSIESEDYFETDFWTMSMDSLEVDESYTEDLAYFLLDEGDLWEAVDLLNELKMEEEISL
jgi:ABC-type phosphate/phosphonate transport system permease subunit